LLKFSGAFNRIDQAGDEISPALILILHLTPSAFHFFVQALEFVVATAGKEK
jgi:hypothetical protein